EVSERAVGPVLERGGREDLLGARREPRPRADHAVPRAEAATTACADGGEPEPQVGLGDDERVPAQWPAGGLPGEQALEVVLLERTRGGRVLERRLERRHEAEPGRAVRSGVA